MGRLSRSELTVPLPELSRRNGARSLQELGLSAIGANQVMNGKGVSDANDREIIASILYKAVLPAVQTLNV